MASINTPDTSTESPGNRFVNRSGPTLHGPTIPNVFDKVLTIYLVDSKVLFLLNRVSPSARYSRHRHLYEAFPYFLSLHKVLWKIREVEKKRDRL